MNKSIQDMTTWCPKHGVAHGVCIDPIRVDEQDPTTGRPMTVEDGEAGDLVVKLRNMVAQLEEECERLRDGFPEPNRFDPYEALDQILETVHGLTVENHVHALRAYITGMER